MRWVSVLDALPSRPVLGLGAAAGTRLGGAFVTAFLVGTESGRLGWLFINHIINPKQK